MDLDRIRRLADAFDASDWDEVDIVVDGVRVRFSAATAPPSAPPPLAGSDVTSLPPSGSNSTSSAAGGVGSSATADASERPPHGEPDLRPEGAEPADVPPEASGDPVGAPSPGIFWRAPSPGEAPFVTVGDHVETDSVVGIVELMKLMNRVAAGVAGTVTAVLVDNGQSVAKAESLVLVEPDP